MYKDTIAAIATAPGNAGIAIIRVSGPEALRIADVVFRHRKIVPSTLPGGRFIHGTVVSPGTQTDLDEVMLLVYRDGHSYTREDTVEFQCHGGRISARRVLNAVVDAGARLADPGEFTKRAFLNGRIDLVQAEAVMDIIQAQSDRMANLAVEQLEGRLSNEISNLYDDCLALSADFEAMLDFEVDELPESIRDGVEIKLQFIGDRLQELEATWNEGRLLREGARVVIAGRPNVGKSTLLNTLLGVPRAIVTPTPGTTRDIIEETLVLDGVPIRLYDTAGLRETGCEVEKIGVDRARNVIDRADLILWVMDGSQPVDQEELKLIKSHAGHCLVILNKSDLGTGIQEKDLNVPSIRTSLTQGTGLDALKTAITETLGVSHLDTLHAAISERHHKLLSIALKEIQTAIRTGTSSESHVIVAQHIATCAGLIGQIIGRNYSDNLLDAVFSRFCIGK